VGAFRNVFIALLNLALKTSSAPESHGCGKVTPESLAPSSSPLLHQSRRRLSSLAEFTARPSDSRKDARCSLFRLWTMVFRCGRCFRRDGKSRKRSTAGPRPEKRIPRCRRDLAPSENAVPPPAVVPFGFLRFRCHFLVSAKDVNVVAY
jgi:hypothetical protein